MPERRTNLVPRFKRLLSEQRPYGQDVRCWLRAYAKALDCGWYRRPPDFALFVRTWERRGFHAVPTKSGRRYTIKQVDSKIRALKRSPPTNGADREASSPGLGGVSRPS